MNDTQLAVYQSLSRALGGKVIDPKYSPAHKRESQLGYLKQWVRDNWPDRKLFPPWVHEWIAQWKAEAAAEAGGERGDGGGGDSEGEGNDGGDGLPGQGRGHWTDLAERVRCVGSDDVERVDNDAAQGRGEAARQVNQRGSQV